MSSVVSWFFWAARVVLAVVIATAVYGVFDGTVFGWSVTVALVVAYGLLTRPVRPLVRALWTARRNGVGLAEARAAHVLLGNFDRVAYTAGVASMEEPRGRDDDEHLRTDDGSPWLTLFMHWLFLAGVCERPRPFYIDVPAVVSWGVSPVEIRLRVRSTARGEDAQDLSDPVVVRHVQEAVRALLGDSITVRAEVEASTVLLHVRFRDPLAGSRDSVMPSEAGPVRIGVDETGENITWNPYEATHTATQGMTRSGKSVQEYTRFSGVAGRADVEVCGLDPTGVLLGPWVDAGCTRIGVPATAGETPVYEHFRQVLDGLVDVMDRRTMQLAAIGKDKLDAADFSAKLPVLVVVLEEWPGILRAAGAEDAAEGRKPAERVAPKIDAGVGRLVAEGAKAGVRVNLLAQRLSAKSLDTDSRSNFGARHTMRVDNADAVGMLHANAAEWAPIVAEFQAGQGLIERPGLGQRRYRADYTSYETYLARVRKESNRR